MDSVYTLYCDGTYVLLSTKASNQPDGSPCTTVIIVRESPEKAAEEEGDDDEEDLERLADAVEQMAVANYDLPRFRGESGSVILLDLRPRHYGFEPSQLGQECTVWGGKL